MTKGKEMTIEQTRMPIMEAVTAQPAESRPSSGFDINRFRLSQDFAAFGSAEKLLSTVPVRKPRKDEFIRVSPDPEHSISVAMLEHGEPRDLYFLTPEIQALGLGVPVSLALAIDRENNPFFWPLKLPLDDRRRNNWQLSALEAAKLAQDHWVRIVADMKLQAYVIYKALGDLPEPVWPEKSFAELLEIAFQDLIIDDPEHIVIKQLNGVE